MDLDATAAEIVAQLESAIEEGRFRQVHEIVGTQRGLMNMVKFLADLVLRGLAEMGALPKGYDYELDNVVRVMGFQVLAGQYDVLVDSGWLTPPQSEAADG